MRWLAGLILSLALAGTAGAQTLTLKGPAGRTATVTPAQLAAMPRETIRIPGPVREVYEGVPVVALAALVGAPDGEAIRGPAMATVVIFTASDGYRVVVALAETDYSFRDRPAIVADRLNGKPLDAEHGPFRLVVADDKRPARWARKLVAMEVRDLP